MSVIDIERLFVIEKYALMNLRSVIQVIVVWALCCAGEQLKPQHDEFSKAAAQLVRRVKLPEARIQVVPSVLQDIERALGTHWLGCRVISFGSITAGDALKHSDVDVFVRLNQTEIDISSGAIVLEAKTVLEQFPDLFTNFYTFLDSLVPIVSFQHIPTGFQVDLKFKNEQSVRHAQLLRYLLHLDERVLDLAIIVKYWAKLHKITVHGSKQFPSSMMTMLLVFYLQQVDMLPPVVSLQTNAEPYIVAGWNTGFEEIHYESRSNSSLYELLGGFFEYYDSYAFKDIIVSTFTGHQVRRQLFKDLQTVPQEFDLYKQNVEHSLTQPLSCAFVCIQDPFMHNRHYADYDILDLGPDSAFMTQFKNAALRYRENNESVFLDEMFTMTK